MGDMHFRRPGFIMNGFNLHCITQCFLIVLDILMGIDL